MSETSFRYWTDQLICESYYVLLCSNCNGKTRYVLLVFSYPPAAETETSNHIACSRLWRIYDKSYFLVLSYLVHLWESLLSNTQVMHVAWGLLQLWCLRHTWTSSRSAMYIAVTCLKLKELLKRTMERCGGNSRGWGKGSAGDDVGM